MLEFIIGIVIGPKPEVQVSLPDTGTTLALLSIAIGSIAFIRAKLK